MAICSPSMETDLSSADTLTVCSRSTVGVATAREQPARASGPKIRPAENRAKHREGPDTRGGGCTIDNRLLVERQQQILGSRSAA